MHAYFSPRLYASLRWRHNGRDSVSNHQPHDCLLSRLFRRRSKKTSKLRVTGLCSGNSPGTGEFPAQMASYAENVSIWWRHHDEHHIDVNDILSPQSLCGGLVLGWSWAGPGRHRQRFRSVVMEGSKSISSPVTSGVPQGSVLWPLLFLLFTNDLPSVLDPATRCRLFADDCLVYRDIRTIEDQIQLQRDLYALETWGTQWGISFNVDKCNIMTVARQTTPTSTYTSSTTRSWDT